MKTVRFLLVAVLLASSIGAVAQTAPTADPCTVQGGTEAGEGRLLEFDGASVGGCFEEMPIVLAPRHPRIVFPLLLNIRANFQPELSKSVADL